MIAEKRGAAFRNDHAPTMNESVVAFRGKVITVARGRPAIRSLSLGLTVRIAAGGVLAFGINCRIAVSIAHAPSPPGRPHREGVPDLSQTETF
jgi:hypothetical protein